MKKILLMLGMALAIMIMPSSNALDWKQVSIAGPSGYMPAGVIGGAAEQLQVGDIYMQTFSLNTAGISWQPCYNQQYYQLGSCDYLYKCYIMMPQGCDQIACAKSYACDNSTVGGVTTHIAADGTIYTDSVPGMGITTLVNPVQLGVRYATSTADIGRTYAVAAFVMKSHMQYDFSLRHWTDTTTPVNTTMLYDSMVISGAPLPQQPNPLSGIAAQLQNIMSGIRAWFCEAFGWFC
jgi:hypothetical protein